MAIIFANGINQENLDRNIMNQMNQMHASIIQLMNKISMRERSLTKDEAEAINYFCIALFQAEWWPKAERLIDIARSHVYHANTVNRLDVYTKKWEMELFGCEKSLLQKPINWMILGK